MRVPRVYLDQPLEAGSQIALPDAQSHYLTTVLRMSEGRPLMVFNGNGKEYQAVIRKLHKRHTEILLESFVDCPRESPLQTHLAIGISRGERMDWVLQKATELGVSRITPLFTERTEVRLQGERLQKKMEHWRQITISACEQCQRNVIPVLAEALDLEAFFKNDESALKLVLHHRSNQALNELARPNQVTLLVGPEGGLSEQEIQRAIDQFGFVPLTLGPRVLRTETAPIVALTATQLLWGDLG